jgi:hypothetical protein
MKDQANRFYGILAGAALCVSLAFTGTQLQRMQMTTPKKRAQSPRWPI